MQTSLVNQIQGEEITGVTHFTLFFPDFPRRGPSTVEALLYSNVEVDSSTTRVSGRRYRNVTLLFFRVLS